MIACRLAGGDGFGKGKLTQESFEVGGVLPRRVEANVEVDARMALRQLLEQLADALIAGARFGEFGGRTSRLEIASEKGDVMAVASGVEPDADGNRVGRGGRGVKHHGQLQEEQRWRIGNQGTARVLRHSFDVGNPCDERSSRKMQRILSQRSEGTIYRKRSSLREVKISSRLPRLLQSAMIKATGKRARITVPTGCGL